MLTSFSIVNIFSLFEVSFYLLSRLLIFLIISLFIINVLKHKINEILILFFEDKITKIN